MDLFALKNLQINVYLSLFPFQKHKDYSEAWYKFNTHERETLKVRKSFLRDFLILKHFEKTTVYLLL